MIITKQAELADFCTRLAACPYITVDTEFLRDKTFYPRLCLLQMAGPGVNAAAIDPIESDLDWAPVHGLMANEKILKVFHAARQDLEIFFQLTGKIPHPIFDTQVAAMVCGYGDSVAYNALVRDLTGQALEKSSQFTDWSRRPLSKQQINYALDDVIHLIGVYEKLDARLRAKSRSHWVKEEMGVLTSPETYNTPVDEVWKRIRIRSDKPEVLAILKALATWREEEARHRDVPRGRILKDEALADLALYRPSKVEDLLRVRSLSPDLAKGKMGKTILDIAAQVRAMPRDQWPRPDIIPIFPRQAQPILEMLKLLLKITCAEEDVSPKLVASSEELELLAVHDTPDIHALKGWRHEIFGAQALDLKAGKIALGLRNGEVRRLPV